MGCETICLDGFGPRPCDLMIIGEAPGATEDREGKPFIGRSGALLRLSLKEAGIYDFYITNAVSCRPPENKTPSKAQIRECHYWVEQRIKAVKPKYILLLGNAPLESCLGIKGIKKARGKPIEHEGIIYLPTFHPAYTMYEPKARVAFEADLKLLKRIIEDGGLPEEKGLNVILVDNKFKVKKLLRSLRGDVAIDIETTDLYPWDVPNTEDPPKRITSIQFGVKGTQFILLTNHPSQSFTSNEIEDIISLITKRLKRCYLIMHSGKFDALWLMVHYGVTWFPDFDTLLAHFLLDENTGHNLKSLSQVFLGAMDYDIDLENKRSGDQLGTFLIYGAKDVYYTLELYYLFKEMLFQDSQVGRVFYKIMMPCVSLFIEAEYRGVYINVDKMADAKKYLQEVMDKSESELNNYTHNLLWDTENKKFTFKKKVSGDDIGKRRRYDYINWNSSDQLGGLLFGHLGIDVVEETKGGKPSTSESVLLRIDHPISQSILNYRAAVKQMTSFITGWEAFLVNNRLHPNFKLFGTVTGRLSCERPNLQQVPRDPRIRSLITAPKGYVLMEADLSQIEMRIAAELSGDRALLEAFRNGIDVHWLTAMREIARGGALKEEVLVTAKALTGEEHSYSESIDIMLEHGHKACAKIKIAWKEYRKKAKAINFGYLYGMGWRKFMIYARDNYGVVVTEVQARASRDYYFELYKDLPAWHNRQRNVVRKNGFVKSLSGRKRRLPDAMRNDRSYEAGRAERQAINSPVQSFANEINLMAAIQLREEYELGEVYIVGAIHDSILMEVREDLVEEVYNRILEIMANPKLFEDFNIQLSVDIEAEASIGPWGSSVSLSDYRAARRTLPRKVKRVRKYHTAKRKVA